MSFPTLTVEAAFGEDPLAASPTWVDITDHVIAMHVITGKQQDLDEYQPGVLELDLDNSGRRFDPLHVDGPYYGQLLPNVRIRVQATINGSTYDVFTGFADGWPQSYKAPADATCHLVATDAFKLLQRSTVRQTSYRDAVLADSPTAYYPMDEYDGTTLVDYSGNENHGIYADGADVNRTDPLLPFETVAHGHKGLSRFPLAEGPVYAAVYGTTWSIEWWLNVISPPTDSTWHVEPFSQDHDIETAGQIQTRVLRGYASMTFYEYPGDYARVRAKATSGTQVVTDDGFGWSFRGGSIGESEMEEGPHHFVMTRNGDTITIYVDGVAREGTTGGTSSMIGNGQLPIHLGALAAGPHGDAELIDLIETVLMGHFATYQTVALNASQVLAHYEAGVRPWDGDTTGERVERVLDLIEWPASMRDIDTGVTVLGPGGFAKSTVVLEHLRTLAASERGALYVDHRDGGKLRFRDRHRVLTGAAHTASQARFSDETGSELFYDDLVLEYDEQLIVNRVEVAWVGGQVVVEDAASQLAYGVQTHQVDTLLKSAQEAEALGDWILGHYKDVLLRVRSLTINPNRRGNEVEAAAWDAALGLSIGDRVTVRRLPQGVGMAIEEELLIEGISHYAGEGVDVWETTFTFSRAEMASYWILGTSALGSTTKLAF